MISKSKRSRLANAVSLTGTLATIGDALDTRNASQASLVLHYTKGGSATDMRAVVQGTMVKDDWTDAFVIEVIEDVSSSTLSAGAATVACGTKTRVYDTTGVYHIPVDCYGAHQIRVQARETGTAGGTLTVYANGVHTAGMC